MQLESMAELLQGNCLAVHPPSGPMPGPKKGATRLFRDLSTSPQEAPFARKI